MATATPPVRVGYLGRWFYAARGFLTPFFGTGTVNVLFGIVGKPMADEFGWSRSVTTNGSRSRCSSSVSASWYSACSSIATGHGAPPFP